MIGLISLKTIQSSSVFKYGLYYLCLWFYNNFMSARLQQLYTHVDCIISQGGHKCKNVWTEGCKLLFPPIIFVSIKSQTNKKLWAIILSNLILADSKPEFCDVEICWFDENHQPWQLTGLEESLDMRSLSNWVIF